MNEDLLYPVEVSYDSTTSKIAIRDIFQRDDWVKYSNFQNPRFDYWLNRFLNLHAKAPSIFSPTQDPILIPALVPLGTFRVTSDAGIIYDGGGFSNGAVLRIRTRGFLMKILFVDKEIVELFKYDMTPMQHKDVSEYLLKDKNNGRTEAS